MVPHETTVLMAARTDRPAPATEARRTTAESGQLAQAAASSNRVKASYEVKRGPVWRRKKRVYPVDPKRAKKEAQLAMKLYGGATGKEIKDGTPFDDPIGF